MNWKICLEVKTYTFTFIKYNWPLFVLESDNKIRRTTKLLELHLEKLSNEIAVRNMILIDYLEDILDHIFDSNSSSPLLLSVVRHCFLVPTPIIIS